MLSFSPFGESSGKQQVRLECWKLERTANVACWIKRWFCWFTIWMSERLGKVVSSEHKEMLHSPKAHWCTSTCLNICFPEHSVLCLSVYTWNFRAENNVLMTLLSLLSIPFLHKILHFWTNITGPDLMWCNAGRFHQRNAVSTVLEMYLCSWTQMLLHSSFFRWQEWLLVVGRRTDVYREWINQSRWVLCFPLGLFMRLVISEASHQASPDYRLLHCSSTANPLSRFFIEARLTTVQSYLFQSLEQYFCSKWKDLGFFGVFWCTDEKKKFRRIWPITYLALQCLLCSLFEVQAISKPSIMWVL